jgi:hypothetical protein
MRCKRTTPYDHGKRWSEDTAGELLFCLMDHSPQATLCCSEVPQALRSQSDGFASSIEIAQEPQLHRNLQKNEVQWKEKLCYQS